MTNVILSFMKQFIKTVPDEVIQWLKKQKEVITPEDLAKGIGVTKHTAYCYLSRLSKCGSIARIAKGKYVAREIYISNKIKRIDKNLKRKMPLTDYIIWSTEAISPIMHYMLAKHIVFIEADKYAVSGIKDILSEGGVLSILNPSAKEFEDLFDLGCNVVILERNEKYATITINGIITASLEKALIDLYFLSTRKKFPLLHSELLDAMKVAMQENLIDLKMFRRYAMRRNVKKELERLLGWSL
jgi:predicted transcriptional regulator